jgi:hypothetical protein
MWLFGGLTPGNLTPFYTPPMGFSGASGSGGHNNTTQAGQAGAIIPIACTINLAYVTATCGSSCSGANTVTMTIVKNGVDQSMSCAATSTTTQNQIVSSGACTANPVSVAAGDSIALKWSQTNFTPLVHYASGVRCQ